MAVRIEDYGLIGDLHTAVLVGNNGSIDWACFPRFDSAACFAALLGTEHNGFWQIAPEGEVTSVERRYRPGSLVLETDFHTTDGVVRITDAMPIREDHPRIVRVVEGIEGSVPMRMRMRPRFDYGKTKPWLRMQDGILIATAGPDALELTADVEFREHEFQAEASFTPKVGERLGFVLTHRSSWDASPDPVDAAATMEATDAWWREWSGRSTYAGGWADEVQRSLITLKALIYAPSGGIVAAATTSLPEFVGGVRNWDYRYCWLRDASLTLDALMAAGYVEEATAWRDWVVRAVAGDPEDIQIMYGLGGERRLDEYELPHLKGYEGSAPVRIGNAASGQLQLDVYGEVVDAIYLAQKARDAADASRRRDRAPAPRVAGEALAGAGRRRLGGSGRSQAVRPLQGDGVGRRGSLGEDGRDVRHHGHRGPLAHASGRDPRRDLSRGLRQRTQYLHAVLRVEAA